MIEMIEGYNIINFNNPIKNEGLEKASEIIAEDICIISNSENTNRIYDFYVIPMNKDKRIEKEQIAYLSNPKEWIRFQMNQYHFSDLDAFCLYFSKIPEEIQYIDFFMENENNTEFIYNFVLDFFSLNYLHLFSWIFTKTKAYKNIFCGTFARVTGGWKFYPIFKEHNSRINEVIKNYEFKESQL